MKNHLADAMRLRGPLARDTNDKPRNDGWQAGNVILR